MILRGPFIIFVSVGHKELGDTIFKILRTITLLLENWDQEVVNFKDLKVFYLINTWVVLLGQNVLRGKKLLFLLQKQEIYHTLLKLLDGGHSGDNRLLIILFDI